MGMNFQKIGDEMREIMTDEDWLAIARLHDKGVAVVVFLPSERDGLSINDVQIAAIKGAYDHITKHGQAAQARDAAVAAMQSLRDSRAETVIK